MGGLVPRVLILRIIDPRITGPPTKQRKGKAPGVSPYHRSEATLPGRPQHMVSDLTNRALGFVHL